MKNLRTISITAITVLAVFAIFSFVTKPNSNTDDKPTTEKFMILTAIESIVPGGMGRSRMYETNENGDLENEVKLRNMYSLVGIKMRNINDNDGRITLKINQLMSKGWKLQHVSTGVQSPAIGPNNSSSQGIFLTRYYFKK